MIEVLRFNPDTEVRHIPENKKRELATMVSFENYVLNFMLIIPKNIDDCDRDDNDYERKYTEEQFRTIRSASDIQKRGRLDFEIILDEWSTSGQNRPKIKHLITLLDKADLYRASNDLRQLVGQEPRVIDHSISGFVTSGPLSMESGSNYSPAFSVLNVGGKSLLDDFQAPTSIEKFDYKILCEKTKGFQTLVGEGGFGKVFLAKNLIPNIEKSAVKRIFVNNEHDRVVRKFAEEISSLAEFRHPNIIKLFGYAINNPNELFLIYEFAQSGSLAQRFKDVEKGIVIYDMKQRVKHLLDAAQGIQYIHGREFLHRDIKPANILLDNDVAKLCDFGLIKQENSNTSTAAIGTQGYMAPEKINEKSSKESDIYALGVVMLETLTGLPHIYRDRHLISFAQDCVKNEEGRKHEILQDLPGFPSNLKQKRYDLIKFALECAAHEKTNRPQIDSICENLKEALTHI